MTRGAWEPVAHEVGTLVSLLRHTKATDYRRARGRSRGVRTVRHGEGRADRECAVLSVAEPLGRDVLGGSLAQRAGRRSPQADREAPQP
jgi:hypothetical protein